jgi:hypothetical protein
MDKQLKLGKLPAKSNKKALLFNNFVDTTIVPPKSFNLWAKRAKFPSHVYGNDSVGDCTRASQVESAMRMERLETRTTPLVADNEVIRVYFDMTWRHYGDGASGAPMPVGWNTPGGDGDLGAYEEDALSDWRRPEYTFKDSKGHALTIDAFTKVNQADQNAVKLAIYTTAGHGVKLCFNIPLAWASQDLNWGAPPTGTPLIGDWMPGSWGGHSTYGYAYSEKGVDIITWGEHRIVSWEAFAIYCDEAYWVLDSVDAWRRKKSTGINIPKLVEAVNDVSSYKIGG